MTEQVIPLREWDGSHGTPDGQDNARIDLVRNKRWSAQDQALLARDRAIEEHCRMLAGKQWDVFVPHLGQFVDPLKSLTDTEKRWRQRPVVNILAKWFLLTHARLTESTPIIAFQPATADRLDQMLAETMDVVCKTLWTGCLDMDQRVADLAAWLIAAGEVYAETGCDYEQSTSQFQLTGPATLSMETADGQTIERDTSEPVPYGADGTPLAQLSPEGDDYGYATPEGAEPAQVTEGDPTLLVYSPLEVRSEWGANRRWEDRRWIIVRKYLPPSEVQRRYGITVQADHQGAGDLSGTAGSLTRLLFGAGNFGSVGNQSVSSGTLEATQRDGYVTVDTMWEKPDANSPASEGNPGGRLLIVCPTHVLHDSIRPYKTAAAGPIRRAQFVQMPGRAGFGSTPLEQMVPLQKTYNRGWAQILEHRNRCTNPITIYDIQSGYADVAENVPGAMVGVDFGANPKPVYYLEPPPLSGDVYKVQQMVLELLMSIGSMQGAEGSAPTEDPSGELISQLRFNADRPVAVAARSLGMLLAGIADDLCAVLPVCWPAEKIISYAGDDAVLRTTTVLPEMWEGKVNVRPDLDNALSETKPAKQARYFRDYGAGVFGVPGSPEANRTYLELSKYPNSNRSASPGGVDKITCERFLNAIGQGVPAVQLQMLPWYNYDVFLETTRNHLAAPEYLDYEEPVKREFGLFFSMILQARVTSAQLQASAQAPIVAAQAAVQGTAQTALDAHSPPPPASGDGQDAPPVGPDSSGPPPTSSSRPPGAKAA